MSTSAISALTYFSTPHPRPTRDCSLKRVVSLLFAAAAAVTLGMFAATPIVERRCEVWNNEMHPLESDVINIGWHSCPVYNSMASIAPEARVVSARRFLIYPYVWAGFNNCPFVKGCADGSPSCPPDQLVPIADAALEQYSAAHAKYRKQAAQKPLFCSRTPEYEPKGCLPNNSLLKELDRSKLLRA